LTSVMFILFTCAFIHFDGIDTVIAMTNENNVACDTGETLVVPETLMAIDEFFLRLRSAIAVLYVDYDDNSSTASYSRIRDRA
jgi:hypothetical protein